MAFTFIQAVGDLSGGDSDTTYTQAITGVGAGNLLAVFVRHDGAPTTISLADNNGNAYTALTKVDHSSAALSGRLFYVVAANSGNATLTATFGAAREYRGIFILEFSHSVVAVWDSVDATGHGNSTAPVTGAFSTTGTSAVVVAGYTNFDTGNDTTSEQVNAAAATDAGFTGGNEMWYQIQTATMTNGTAAATISPSSRWLCCAAAFKEEIAGAGPPVGSLLLIGTGM